MYRSKNSLALKLLVFVSALSFLVCFASSQNVNAATNNIENDVSSYIYAKAFIKCGELNSYTGISFEDINNNKYFKSGQTNIGYMFNSGSGVGCKDSGTDSWTFKALSLWGLKPASRQLEIACSLGLERYQSTWAGFGSDTKECLGTDGESFRYTSNSNFKQNFLNEINKYYYKNPSTLKEVPDLSAEQAYLFYLKSFTIGGGASYVGDVEKLSATDKASLGLDKSYEVSIVNDNYEVVNSLYKSKNLGKGDQVTIYENTPNSKMSMIDIVKNINDNSKAYAKYLKDNSIKPSTISITENTDTNTQAQSSCGIELIGWIVCPVLTVLSKITDAGYQKIEGEYLPTKINIFETDGDVYKVWQQVRNLANIGLVIAFLVIIFSQLSSIGISNYGIKKMLPRLVVAAILINLSFLVCTLSADISNVLGQGIRELITNLDVLKPKTSSGTDTAYTIAGVVEGVIGVGAGLVALGSLAALGPILLAGFLAVCLAFLILAARQALIVFLVIISPLAFLAYMLPNTEKLFTQWRKIFFSMLLIYPVIALVYYTSQIASNVLRSI